MFYSISISAIAGLLAASYIIWQAYRIRDLQLLLAEQRVAIDEFKNQSRSYQRQLAEAEDLQLIDGLTADDITRIRETAALGGQRPLKRKAFETAPDPKQHLQMTDNERAANMKSETIKGNYRALKLKVGKLLNMLDGVALNDNQKHVEMMHRVETLRADGCICPPTYEDDYVPVTDEEAAEFVAEMQRQVDLEQGSIQDADSPIAR